MTGTTIGGLNSTPLWDNSELLSTLTPEMLEKVKQFADDLKNRKPDPHDDSKEDVGKLESMNSEIS